MIFAKSLTPDPDALKLKSNKPYVVLAGMDCLQGLQTARILSAEGVPVIGLIGDRQQYFGHTRTCESILEIPHEPDGLVKLLEALGPKFSEKAVLITCNDHTVHDVSGKRDRISEWYHIALPSHDDLDMLMDKVRFYKFAEENSLQIPKTWFLHDRADAERVAEETSYPVVIKPPYRSSEWTSNTSEKAFKINNKEEFLACFDKYKPFADVLIAQHWIEGDDTSLYSCNCYFDRNGECLVTFTARKIRQYPPRTGQSSLGEEVRADEVLDETVRLFKSVHYHGLGYLEMKKDSITGEYFIVEPNIGRPTGRSAIAEAGGVSILYTMYCDLVGLPLPENRTQSYGNAKWVHLLRDLKSAYYYWRQGELSLAEWRRSMSGRKYYAVLSLRDPGPFISAIISTLFSSNKV